MSEYAFGYDARSGTVKAYFKAETVARFYARLYNVERQKIGTSHVLMFPKDKRELAFNLIRRLVTEARAELVIKTLMEALNE